ncbi:MAG: hypothetical protein RIF41_08715 [Polyangiaceae bacterium]
MNEYTRREEIRWTLATVFILVPAVAVAIVRLVLAQGPMVTDPEAIKSEAAAKQTQLDFRPCTKASKKLAAEVSVFKTRAAQAKKKAKEDAPRNKKDDDLEYDLSWSTAAPVLKYAKALHKSECRSRTEAAAGSDGDADAVWDGIKKAAKIKDPGQTEGEQQKAAKELLAIFGEAQVDAVDGHAQKAEEKLAADLEAATKKRETALVRAPLPTGLFPRGAAIGVGVGVSLAALIISYISVRSASMRRGRTLMSLRRFANTPEAGLQAAAIVRLAAHHNGGEPGLVIGSALGGLLAALLSPTDNPNIFIADLFVAGSMGGLLIGLAAQWLFRTLTGVNRWRERTKELGDIEKPTIPVALVLGGVTPGLEKQFLRYFEALPVADAATVVQKLAAQAEEQILAAADASHQAAAAQGGSWDGPVGGM